MNAWISQTRCFNKQQMLELEKFGINRLITKISSSDDPVTALRMLTEILLNEDTDQLQVQDVSVLHRLVADQRVLDKLVQCAASDLSKFDHTCHIVLMQANMILDCARTSLAEEIGARPTHYTQNSLKRMLTALLAIL